MDIIKYRENKSKNILIVENEQVLSKIYFEILSSAGYKVLIAKDGDSALNIYKNNKIHLILLDILLPDISGLEILQRLRGEGESVKIIMLTNIGNDKIKAECMSFGISAYMEKSDYTPDQILKAVEDVLLSIAA